MKIKTILMKSIKNKATAYVCKNYACQQPTTEIDTMLRSIGAETFQEKMKS